MIFTNREQAATLLAKVLIAYKNKNPLVLAIPRGAAPMARIIADTLNGEMDVVLVHKLGAPFQEELAIGSVDEQGHTYLNEFATHATKEYIEQETKRQLAVLRARRVQYTQNHPSIAINNRIVIVVDDGIATGATMIAALKSLRTQHPQQLIVAAAVAPADTEQELNAIADQVVILETPPHFNAVGEFFENFPQVSDEEVIALLEKH